MSEAENMLKIFSTIFGANFSETLYNFPPMLINHMINTRLFQLTRYDSRTSHDPDMDGAKWSHKTNKYQILLLFDNLISFSSWIHINRKSLKQ